MTTREGTKAIAGGQTGRVRYVFAGTDEREDEPGTKVCPRCGATLFADLDVCYGCLYDFTRNEGRAPAGRPAAPVGISATVPPVDADPLAGIALDEIDDDPDRNAPRHRREEHDAADDTVDLAKAALTIALAASEPELAPLLEVSSPALRLRVPVPGEGLTIGRSEASAIVLRAPAVSRNHVRLSRRDGHLVVEDCGATNPATLAGSPLEGAASLAVGDSFDVCGTTFTVLPPKERI